MRLAAAALLSALLLLGAGSAQAVPGNLDPSFGRQGVVVSRLAALPKVVSGTAAGVVLQADGKIVVGGTLQQLTGGASPTFGLARYLVTPGCRVPDVRGRLLERAKRHAGVGRLLGGRESLAASRRRSSAAA